MGLTTERIGDDKSDWTFKPSPHQIEDGFKFVFMAQATWLLLKGEVVLVLSIGRQKMKDFLKLLKITSREDR